MRTPRIVARAALTAALALAVLPALAASTPPSVDRPIEDRAFTKVQLDSDTAGAATIPTLEPDGASAGSLSSSDVLAEVGPRRQLDTVPRPDISAPEPDPVVVIKNPWRHDPEISFYGPGFYGKRTACGLAYTTEILGVAHRTLPCGTLITFRNPANGLTITVPVIDRGPYVAGRIWDLSGAACQALDHCYTGPIDWKYR